MKLSQGDHVTSDNISIGKYEGKTFMYDKEFHKVFDNSKSMTVFIPIDNEGGLRKLPSPPTVEKYLKLFDREDLIEIGEVEGSRYKFFRDKLKSSSFKTSVEVLHDLAVLHKDKKSTASEKKLYSELREKMVQEMSFILGKDSVVIEERILQ
jgi:RNA polymerase-interacting CarD/CdnL/TRCF family regulator